MFRFLKSLIQSSQFERVWRGNSVKKGKEKVDLVICLPVTNGELVGVMDILESAAIYLDGSYHIVFIDDHTEDGTFDALTKLDNVTIFRNKQKGGIPGLYFSLSKVFNYVLDNFTFDFLLKMDTDAFITGKGLISDIRGYFKANPKAGLLGSFRFDCNGTPRDISYFQNILREEYRLWKNIIEEAVAVGCHLGENVLGGAYILSHECLYKIRKKGYLSIPFVRQSKMIEDPIFSLLTNAAGYEIHGFCSDGQPLALAWKGLPMSKETILEKNKKIIHSVKFNEQDLAIRAYFRDLRNEFKTQPKETETDGKVNVKKGTLKVNS